MPDLTNINMAVEINAISGKSSIPPGDDIPARIFVAVASGIVSANQLCNETMFRKAFIEIIAYISVIFSRGIQSGDADKILRQRDQRPFIKDVLWI